LGEIAGKWLKDPDRINFDRKRSGTFMGLQTGKAAKIVSAVKVVKAISTLAIVVVPVAATVGAIVGYGAYFLVKRLKQKS